MLTIYAEQCNMIILVPTFTNKLIMKWISKSDSAAKEERPTGKHHKLFNKFISSAITFVSITKPVIT